MSAQAWLWAGFGVLVTGSLAVDLGLFQRKAHVVRAREALVWTLVWISLALAFNAGIYYLKGPDPAKYFLAGYLLEKALSVDNLFVFLVIFSYFGVPAQYESRILMWGILGALIMRAIFVVAGGVLIQAFGWMMYVFGAILVLTGFKLLVKQDGALRPEANPVLRLFKKLFRTTDRLDGQRFFTRVDGRLAATPLFVVLLVVETTDVIFAVDSIPAVFGIFPDRSSVDLFVVYTSNVFAILGLRALYFLLARLMTMFRLLKFGLVAILWFIGVKMLIGHHYKIPIGASLGVIGSVLALSMALSLLIRKPHAHDGTAAEKAESAPPP